MRFLPRASLVHRLADSFRLRLEEVDLEFRQRLLGDNADLELGRVLELAALNRLE